MPRDSVVHVVPDKMGGVLTNIASIQGRFGRETFSHHAVLVHHLLSRDTRFGGVLPVDSQVTIEHRLPLENVHSVLRRLSRALPVGGGVLVANDWLELAMLCRHGTERAVFSVLHGEYDYYFDLATKHESVIDVFIACSRSICDRLEEILPHRRESIHHIAYGVPLAEQTRCAIPGSLRLLYAGRLDRGKGIFELPLIDDALRERGVRVKWTVAGGGPDEEELRARWKGAPDVRWAGVLSNQQTLGLMAEHDVFVLASRAEGLPVALLECMSVGLVPVVSDVSGGVRELVIPGANGYLLPMGDVGGFAEAIAILDADRYALDELSSGARRRIADRYGIERQVAGYQDLFSRWRELRRPKPRRPVLHYGSRLDQTWIPNALVRIFRSWSRRDLAANRRAESEGHEGKEAKGHGRPRS